MKQSRWRSLWTWTLRGSLPNSKPETRNRLVMHGRSGIVILAAVVSIVGLWHARVEAQADWKKSWETVIQAARKEGEVTIYGPHNPVYQQVWAIFQKTYPEIKFSFVPSKGSDHAQRIVVERRAGKYLADVLMGGSSTYASFAPDTMAVINRAPHPNATKLFVNWVLSREGQTAWQKYTEVNSLRMDIPKTDLPPDDVPQKGVNYFMLNSSRYNGQAGRKALRKIVEDALKRAGKGG
jgi:ABC-type glycerol-3-phosphate transport system substrate-binding protein